MLCPRRSDDDPKELASRSIFTCQNRYVGFPTTPRTVLKGCCRRFHAEREISWRFVCDHSIFHPLAPVEVIEATGQGGQGIPATAPVSYDFLAKPYDAAHPRF